MGLYSRLFLVSALASLPTAALGQASETSSTTAGAVDLDALKLELRESLREELKEELKSQLKEEIKAEIAEEAAATAPVTEDAAWAEEEWKWEEPVKPELNFLEFDGYFRFRYDFFYNLDLGTYYKDPTNGNESGPFAPGFAPPVPLCNTDVAVTDGMSNAPNACNGDSDSLGGANMRFRLEPVFNVYEDVKLKMQIDILDNLVLGSTPDNFPRNPISPLSGFSQTQLPPTAGQNTIWTDSIRVKRAWAEIMTPLGQLRVGRMPSHFGMGLLANEGRGIDGDFGDTNDRIMFATKIGDFYIVPAFDWVVSGPTSDIEDMPYGQPFDRDQRDDVDQYILAIVKRDKPEEIERKLANDGWTLNGGTYQVGRFQTLDAANYYNNGDPRDQATESTLLNRDVQAYIYSYWGELRYQKLTVEAEYAGIIGKIGNSAVAGGYGAQAPKLTLNQHAASVKISYKALKDALTIELLSVVATGDSAAGWGVRPFIDASGTAGIWDGSQAPGGGDNNINNFRVDPNFVVDMILWRQLVGTITDALIVRPSVQYNLTQGFGARLDLIYSRALHASSTPSGSFTNDSPLGNPNANLGLEADVKVFYDSEDGFHAWLQYGLFIPFAGLDRQTVVHEQFFNNTATEQRAVIDGDRYVRLDAGVAHTLQVLLGVSF